MCALSKCPSSSDCVGVDFGSGGGEGANGMTGFLLQSVGNNAVVKVNCRSSDCDGGVAEVIMVV